MDKINFQNLPDTTTPVNATNLNQIQTNVDNAKVEKTIILTNPDLNNITTETNFYFASSGTNRPEETNGYLLVQRYNNNYVSQEYITTGGVKYTRVLRNSIWSEWKEDGAPEFVSSSELGFANSWVTNGQCFGAILPRWVKSFDYIC